MNPYIKVTLKEFDDKGKLRSCAACIRAAEVNLFVAAELICTGTEPHPVTFIYLRGPREIRLAVEEPVEVVRERLSIALEDEMEGT